MIRYIRFVLFITIFFVATAFYSYSDELEYCDYVPNEVWCMKREYLEAWLRAVHAEDEGSVFTLLSNSYCSQSKNGLWDFRLVKMDTVDFKVSFFNKVPTHKVRVESSEIGDFYIYMPSRSLTNCRNKADTDKWIYGE